MDEELDKFFAVICKLASGQPDEAYRSAIAALAKNPSIKIIFKTGLTNHFPFVAHKGEAKKMGALDPGYWRGEPAPEEAAHR
jgi:hypothetical protein